MIHFIFAQANAPQPQGAASILNMLPMFVLILAVFYFVVYRPQQKEQKKRKELISALKKGDKVVTAGGIHGIVVSVKDDIVSVKVCDDVKLDISKSSISVVNSAATEKQ